MFSVQAKMTAYRSQRGFIALLIGLLFGLVFNVAHGQSYASSYVPGDYEHGDTIAIQFDLALNGDPFFTSDRMLLECEFGEDFSIDSLSQLSINLEESPLCADGQCSATLTINHETGSLNLLLVRPDSIVIGNEGKLARVDGIGVIIDDIFARKGASETPISSLECYPNPARGQVSLRSVDHSPLGLVSIRDVNGRVIFERVFIEPVGQVSLRHFPAGIYWVHSKASTAAIRLIIRP